MTLTKTQKAEREEYRENLRGYFPPGSTVYTILRRVSRSGMMRHIGVLAKLGDDFRHPNYATSKALGVPLGDGDAVKVGGCGMDMGFHLAYEISAACYPEGFGCIGEGCPSNDHSNGDRDFTPHTPNAERTGADGKPCSCCNHHWHKDGGYALKHRWL